MLSPQNKHAITESINAWIDEKNPARSGNKLAEKAAVSSAYISKIRNGEYEIPGGGGRSSVISDATFHRIADALGVNFNGGLHWDFVYNFQLIQRTCRKSQKKMIRYILDGYTGLGKTFGVEHYSITSDYVVYVKCTQNMSTKGLLDTILHRLGVHDNVRGNYEKLELIRKYLTGRKGYLIIIDELEVVKLGIYAVIKDIADFTQGKCGMIITGMQLIKKLDALAARQKPGFPQLRRRFFGNQAECQPITQGEIVAVCEHEKIRNKGAHNVLTRVVNDFDMLAQYVADIKEWQEDHEKQITGEELIELLGINVMSVEKGGVG